VKNRGGAYGPDGGHGGFHQGSLDRQLFGGGRELEMSQASVTKRIKELESWLGARLLNRTRRRLSLTEIGTGFYERSMRFLEAVEEARSGALR